MDGTIDILNKRYSVSEQLVIEECSGKTSDHTEKILTHLAKADESHQCQCGNRVIVIDGEVVSQNERMMASHLQISE